MNDSVIIKRQLYKELTEDRQYVENVKNEKKKNTKNDGAE